MSLSDFSSSVVVVLSVPQWPLAPPPASSTLRKKKLTGHHFLTGGPSVSCCEFGTAQFSKVNAAWLRR